MFRHQLTILRKESVAAASAVLLLLAGTADLHSATISLSGLNRTGAWNTVLPETQTVTFSVENAAASRAALNTVSGTISAESYSGASITANSTIQFNSSSAPASVLTMEKALTLTFEGTVGSTFTINQTNGLKDGGTLLVKSGTVRIADEAGTLAEAKNLNFQIESGAALALAQNQKSDSLAIRGGTLTLDASSVLTSTAAKPVSLSGNAAIQIAQGSQYLLASGASAGTIQVAGPRANALITGLNGTVGQFVLGGAASESLVKNGIIDVQNANSSMTINAPVVSENAALSGGLSKTGTGTLVLGSDANSYVGSTVVKQGTLLLNDGAKIYSGTANTLSDAEYQNIVSGFNSNAAPSYAPNRSVLVVGDSKAAGSAVVSVGDVAAQLGNLSTSGKGLILDGGTLAVTGKSQVLDRGMTVSPIGGAVVMEREGETLTVSGASAKNTQMNLYGNLTFGGKGNFNVSADLVDSTAGKTASITKAGAGTMTQKWSDGASRLAAVNVNEGTYAAAGTINAASLNLNGGNTVLASGSKVAGDVIVGKNASFSAGYAASQDSTLLNSVGTIDVNGNMRVNGRLIVDVANGQVDAIAVTGNISLGDDFKFVVNVDSYDSYIGWTEMDLFSGDFDAETLDMLEKMMEDGTLGQHLEGDGLVLRLNGDGSPVLADTNAVPEPASILLMVFGIAGLGFLRRRAALKK